MRVIEKRVRVIQYLMVIVLSVLMLINVLCAQTSATAAESDPLSLWTDGCESKEALVNYITTITDESSADFIPVQDRIAVFDLDGTLFCETDPVYFDHMLLQYRVLSDPTYKDQASEFEIDVANRITEFAETGTYPSDMSIAHGQAVASAFSGMTLDEFTAYVINFRETPANGYNGMTKGDGFYKPMIEVINYLQANDFSVYIVSGTDRFIVRGLVAGKLPIPPCNILGSDESLVASNQGDTDGLDYLFTPDDQILLGGNFIVKDLKMNKVSAIAREIGKQPVLSFGNSSGDYSMDQYVINNNKYKSMAFMLCCDDTERENGKISAAEKMYADCQTYGWVPISMKNDWVTIYGDDVVRK